MRVDRLTQMYLLAGSSASDPGATLRKLAEATVLSGADGQALSPDEARAAIQQETARIEGELLPILKRLRIA